MRWNGIARLLVAAGAPDWGPWQSAYRQRPEEDPRPPFAAPYGEDGQGTI